METFSKDTQVVYNGIPFPNAEAIRQIHVALGFDSKGALEGLRVNPEREHFTDDEIGIEGHLSGKHVGPFFGFEPTGLDVQIPYVTFYRFDAAGKLASERVVLNLGALTGWAGGRARPWSGWGRPSTGSGRLRRACRPRAGAASGCGASSRSGSASSC